MKLSETGKRFVYVIAAVDASCVRDTSPLVPRPSSLHSGCSRSRAGGFTYIGLLIFIALMGVALAGTGVVFHRQAQREKEKELLFVGDQFRRAIGQYYERSPGGDKRYPAALTDLLQDKRYPATQRYLRHIYRDPLTGGSEWGLVRRDDGSITGVYSLAKGDPAKQANFPAAYQAFEGKTRYADWVFAYAPVAAPAPDSQVTKPPTR